MWFEDTCQLVRGSYATGDGEVTFSARAMAAGVRVAVVEVLRKAWRHHEDATGEGPLFQELGRVATRRRVLSEARARAVLTEVMCVLSL